MAKRLATPFDAWEFKEDELPPAQILTDLQTKHVQHLMSQDALEKLTMSVEVTNYNYKQEYLRGKLEFASHLLSISDSARGLFDTMIEDRRRTEQAMQNPKE